MALAPNMLRDTQQVLTKDLDACRHVLSEKEPHSQAYSSKEYKNALRASSETLDSK